MIEWPVSCCWNQHVLRIHENQTVILGAKLWIEELKFGLPIGKYSEPIKRSSCFPSSPQPWSPWTTTNESPLSAPVCCGNWNRDTESRILGSLEVSGCSLNLLILLQSPALFPGLISSSRFPSSLPPVAHKHLKSTVNPIWTRSLLWVQAAADSRR